MTIDVGGTGVKFLAQGETRPRRIESGHALEPAEMVESILAETQDWAFDVVSLGIPALVGRTGPVTEPVNLGRGWVGFDFAAAFGRPVRIVNDATMQALGSYDGGRMLFLDFGTGVGSVLVIDHTIVPLELGELKGRKRTFGEQFANAALERLGEKQWRRRVLATIPSLQRAFLADYVVIGGGNSKYVLEPLPPNVRIGHNLTAFRGGYRLWEIEEFGDDRDRGAGKRWRLL